MPVSFLNQPQGYQSEEEADYYGRVRREEELNKKMAAMGKLAEAFQSYKVRQRDREIMGRDVNPYLPPQTSIDQNRQLPQGAAINDPNSPLTSPGGARFNVQTGQPMGGIPQIPQAQPRSRWDIMGRMKDSFNSQMPLSTLEKAMAEQRIKQMFDPYENELKKAQVGYYSRRGYGSTASRAPRGLDEIYNAIMSSEPDAKDNPSQKEYKAQLRNASLAELRRYQQNNASSDSDISEEDIQYTMQKYGLTRQEVIDKLEM